MNTTIRSINISYHDEDIDVNAEGLRQLYSNLRYLFDNEICQSGMEDTEAIVIPTKIFKEFNFVRIDPSLGVFGAPLCELTPLPASVRIFSKAIHQ